MQKTLKTRKKKRNLKNKIESPCGMRTRVYEPGSFFNIVLLDFYTVHVVIMNSDLIGGVKDGGY